MTLADSFTTGLGIEDASCLWIVDAHYSSPDPELNVEGVFCLAALESCNFNFLLERHEPTGRTVTEPKSSLERTPDSAWIDDDPPPFGLFV